MSTTSMTSGASGDTSLTTGSDGAAFTGVTTLDTSDFHFKAVHG